MSAQITRITRKLARLGMEWAYSFPGRRWDVGDNDNWKNRYIILDQPITATSEVHYFSSLAKLERWLTLTEIIVNSVVIVCVDGECHDQPLDTHILEQARRELEG